MPLIGENNKKFPCIQGEIMIVQITGTFSGKKILYYITVMLFHPVRIIGNTFFPYKNIIRLEKAGFTVLRHRLIPPNDGGIALGQAAAAMEVLK